MPRSVAADLAAAFPAAQEFVVYSHHQFDHVAGGTAFKDAGASVVVRRYRGVWGRWT